MKYIDIPCGNTTAHLSALAFGGSYLGTLIPQDRAFELLESYIEQGGNIIDTARSYAYWLPNGESASERTIGAWLRASGMREKISLHTKGGMTAKGVNPYRSDLSLQNLTKELGESLEALGVDYVDFYWLHRDRPDMPVEEIVDICAELASKGQIRQLAVSNWSVERLEAANRYAKATGKQPFAANQIQFSLASCCNETWGDHTVRFMDDATYARHTETQTPIFAYTSQAQGFFSVAIERGIEALTEDTRQKFYYGENLARIERVREYCARTGLSPAAVSLAWLLCGPFPTVALIGSGSKEHLAEYMAAADCVIPPEDIAWLRSGNR